jgi:hypothetical protein
LGANTRTSARTHARELGCSAPRTEQEASRHCSIRTSASLSSCCCPGCPSRLLLSPTVAAAATARFNTACPAVHLPNCRHEHWHTHTLSARYIVARVCWLKSPRTDTQRVHTSLIFNELATGDKTFDRAGEAHLNSSSRGRVTRSPGAPAGMLGLGVGACFPQVDESSARHSQGCDCQ